MADTFQARSSSTESARSGEGGRDTAGQSGQALQPGGLPALPCRRITNPNGVG